MLSAIWRAVKRVLAALSTTLDYLVPVMFIALGGMMLYYSVFERVPAPNEMIPVTGHVSHYRIERSRADNPRRIDFKLWNDDTPYWTDEFDDRWVNGQFDGEDLPVEFHTESGPVFRGGTVKTFGLKVDGRIITRLEDDLASDTKLLRNVFPVLGLVIILIGFWKWPRKPEISLQPDGTMAETQIDKGFEFSWQRLSPRRQFIRSCWFSSFAVLIVLLVKPQPLWILGTLIGCAIWTGSLYWAWTNHAKQ
jgi:hypothetical protein